MPKWPPSLTEEMAKANANVASETAMVARLRTMAGMLTIGEKIAFGADAELMLEAADLIEDMIERLNNQ